MAVKGWKFEKHPCPNKCGKVISKPGLSNHLKWCILECPEDFTLQNEIVEPSISEKKEQKIQELIVKINGVAIDLTSLVAPRN